MYYWRDATDIQREEIREYRRLHRFPRHSPPHFDDDLERNYLLTGTCYEHQRIIGTSHTRMTEYESELLETVSRFAIAIWVWCVLPNHFHILLKTARMKEIRSELGRLNGRTSFKWNGEDDTRGRKVWHNCFERRMRSDRHYFASLNYVLNNPVHHGYVQKWEEWPWSNATEYLESVGREKAIEIWEKYPVLDYGSKWDVD